MAGIRERRERHQQPGLPGAAIGGRHRLAGRTRRAPRPVRLIVRWLVEFLGLLLVAAVAIAAAPWLTPMQTVTAAGQVIKVGATTPTLTVSGPGELDMFGQRLPTNQMFAGPVRPRLQLAQISINGELATFVEGARHRNARRVLGDSLVAGWKRYFAWETAVAGAGAVLLVGAVAGWRRISPRPTIALLAAGLVITEAVNLGAIMASAYSAPATLGTVRSLSGLVGTAAHFPRSKPRGRPLPRVQVVVLGDSTAAGAGLPLVPRASLVDRDCGRSADSYAADLAAANGWNVLNLACDGATIRHGVLGSQDVGGPHLPPQLDIAEQARQASVVIVSVGADDMRWAAMLQFCATAPSCNDRATTAFFQQQLASFSKDYLTLLSRLASLPTRPHVIVNQYYDPFGPQANCLGSTGLTAAKIATLTARLATINVVLADGAAQFGFASPQPEFAGHQLCAPQPYVQGPGSPAPVHPTTLGQLAIALTDQAVLTAPNAGPPGIPPVPGPARSLNVRPR